MAEASNLRTIDEAIVELLTSYQELNGAYVDELEKAPSPLILMQHVAQNRPFVVRGAAADWPALSLWSAEYLNTTLGESTVKVAVTPSGNADSAVTSSTDGETYFTKPLEIDERFDDFLSYIRQQEAGEISRADVKYSQARKT
ncbi:MAG: hypothetical protein Q9181_000188 [Wetmoreana brouardii]